MSPERASPLPDLESEMDRLAAKVAGQILSTFLLPLGSRNGADPSGPV